MFFLIYDLISKYLCLPFRDQLRRDEEFARQLQEEAEEVRTLMPDQALRANSTSSIQLVASCYMRGKAGRQHFSLFVPETSSCTSFQV